MLRQHGCDGTPIDLVATGNNFSVWREKYGTRILPATGLWSSRTDWQRALTRQGTAFSKSYLTDVSTIAGRSCPIHTFLDPWNLNARGQCLYYSPSTTKSLDSEAATAGRVSGEDYIENWDSPDSLTPAENPELPGWYEGNIKFCADKGMRMPTYYETAPTYHTWGTINDANPARAMVGGIPSSGAGGLWTASGVNGPDFVYFQFYLAPEGGGMKQDSGRTVRCVIPSAPPPPAVPPAPTNLIVNAGHEAVRVSWTIPANAGRPMITDYVVQYAAGSSLNWITFPHPASIKTQLDVTGLTNGTSYVFRVAAVNATGTGAFSSTSTRTVPATPTCGATGQGCYDSPGALAGGRAQLPGGTVIELASAASGFSVWRERGGSRILRATGLWSSDADWQKALNRRGLRFATTDLTDLSNIAGRVCPSNVFLDHDNKFATNRCLYYDVGQNSWALSAAYYSGGTNLVEGEDYLLNWSSPGTAGPLSDPTEPSWYEGNIKLCADKGMRLPTYYELKAKTQTLANDGTPVFGGTRVPIVTGQYLIRSASASGYQYLGAASFFGGDPIYFQSGLYGERHSGSGVFTRCVIPSEPAPQTVPTAPTNLVVLAGKNALGAKWTAPANTGRAQIFDYLVQYSDNNGQSWTTATRTTSSEARALITGLSASSAYLVRVAAVNSAGTGAFATSTATVTPATPTCGGASSACYDHPGALAGKSALLADGTEIELVAAGGTLSVWKEKNGTRILGATGRWSSSADWQKKLIRRGNDFSTTDFTDIAQLTGRACPTNVFVTHSNMTSTSNCVYYDAGTIFGPALYSSAYGSTGVESEDFIRNWNSASSAGPPANPTLPSWYEGNVKGCADKGMRMPTRYELNGGGAVTPTGMDAAPVFGGARVPPADQTWTWSSSAGGGGAADTYFTARHTGSWTYGGNVRCVIPAQPPAPSTGKPQVTASAPVMTGNELTVTAAHAGTVVLYKDSACFGAVGKAVVATSGSQVRVAVKSVAAGTRIYGRVFDKSGNVSRCEFVAVYDPPKPVSDTIYGPLDGYCVANTAGTGTMAPFTMTAAAEVSGLLAGTSLDVRVVARGGSEAAREVVRQTIRANGTVNFAQCDPRHSYDVEVVKHPVDATGRLAQICHVSPDGRGKITCVDANIEASRMRAELAGADVCVSMSDQESGAHFAKSVEGGKSLIRARSSGNIYVRARETSGGCAGIPLSVVVTHRGDESSYGAVSSSRPDAEPLVIMGVVAGDEIEIKMDNLTGTSCEKSTTIPVLRSSSVSQAIITGGCPDASRQD
ncbi:fibronectin type III domain-containing protein [bacterium]|nr:fibronectin type III domain-containing protein [bacterium]